MSEFQKGILSPIVLFSGLLNRETNGGNATNGGETIGGEDSRFILYSPSFDHFRNSKALKNRGQLSIL